MEANLIEKYNGWYIFQNIDTGDFFISGDYNDENVTITEDTLEDMKILIDYL